MVVEPLALTLFLELLACTLLVEAAKAPEQFLRLLNMNNNQHHINNNNNFLIRNADRRPSPSESLPVLDIIENVNTIYDPAPSDIDVKKLRKQLGRRYDKRYMSIYTPPKRRRHRKFTIPFKRGRPVGKRPKFLKSLRSARLQDGRKIRLDVGKKERRKFQKYIWSLTFCPLKHTWKDLGIRFWPQWVKKGSCSSERSCSIPAGMKCQESDKIHKTFLRWYCSDYHRKKNCRWIPVQYPIVTACSCICGRKH